MCTRSWLMVALAAALAACGAAPAPDPAQHVAAGTEPTPAAASTRVVVLGDSIAAGLGLPEGEAFPAVLEDLLRERGFAVDVVNAGVSGDTSAGGVTRVGWILRQEPDVVLVELGANDALRGQPLESIEANLREIVRRARAAGAEVVLAGMDVPTSYGAEYGDRFAAMYERVAAEERAILVPGFLREVGVDPGLMQPDGLHPTAEGQRRLAETVLPHVEAALKAARNDG